jgi:glycogen phosphorylase
VWGGVRALHAMGIFPGVVHLNEGHSPGKSLLQQISRLARDPRFAGKIVFLEDYDISVGRTLVQGVDVWANTPRRPLEACGTSGQKTVLNGGLNMSILDGWWAESYDARTASRLAAARPTPTSRCTTRATATRCCGCSKTR